MQNCRKGSGEFRTETGKSILLENYAVFGSYDVALVSSTYQKSWLSRHGGTPTQSGVGKDPQPYIRPHVSFSGALWEVLVTSVSSFVYGRRSILSTLSGTPEVSLGFVK